MRVCNNTRRFFHFSFFDVAWYVHHQSLYVLFDAVIKAGTKCTDENNMCVNNATCKMTDTTTEAQGYTEETGTQESPSLNSSLMTCMCEKGHTMTDMGTCGKCTATESSFKLSVLSDNHVT